MLLSMTGYANGTDFIDFKSAGKVPCTVEIKAINSRFFEAVCKMPTALSALEVKIIHLLQKSLHRGRVSVVIRLGKDNEIFESIEASHRTIEGYLDAVKNIQQRFELQGHLSINDVINLPNVFVSEKTELSEDEEKSILVLVEKVAKQLCLTRLEEGVSLENDLQKRFVICSEKMEAICKISEKLISDQKALIAQHIALVQSGDETAKIQLDDLYAALNKLDIHEEITRFNSHLASIKTFLVTSKEDKGKRLDFIAQELLRETNTIMAKCSSFDISTLGVDVKVELEKVREQVQNIV